MTQLRQKNILITGAACGIGRRMALAMAGRGGTIVAWDLNEAGLDRLVSDVEAEAGKGKAHGYRCDVADRKQVYEVAERVKAEVGGIDVLVNNAGIVSGKRFLDIPDERIEATFAVNTLAHFWTAKAFLPAMIARNSGHIVTVASSAGLVGVARMSDYCASKWAAVGFDESLRMELKQIAPGVKTTVVCPFFIDTGMFEGVKTRFPLLLPISKEKPVADRIVEAVERNEPQLMIPPIVNIVPLCRALPVALFDTVANVLGINASMESFVGRAQGARTVPAER